jgi:hypothetical protein
VDVFWGRGPDADLAASEMKQPGELYVLVPKPSGIRPLSPLPPDMMVEPRLPEATAPETARPAPDVEVPSTEPATQAAEAGARGIVDAPPADAVVDPDPAGATTF